jgi:hypothetical protein
MMLAICMCNMARKNHNHLDRVLRGQKFGVGVAHAWHFSIGHFYRWKSFFRDVLKNPSSFIPALTTTTNSTAYNCDLDRRVPPLHNLRKRKVFLDHAETTLATS